MTTTSITTAGAPSPLLGETARIPTAGKIRAGIRVLTRAAAANADAQAIYQKGLTAGASFDAIGKRIREHCAIERALTPKNTPYFVARRCDFRVPEIADLILQRFGETRDDGHQLYRFPVLFPLDDWRALLPHGLKCYTRSELKYWSEYDGAGHRYCMTRQAPPADPRNRRARRGFGGRQKVLRSERDGVCAPSECPEYQDRHCNLSGSLIFYIPGIPGSGALELPTTSFYSLQQMRQTLELVSHIRGGRVSGLVDGKPIFYLTKNRREVSMIQDDGQAKRVKQWIVELEADIDISRLFHDGDGDRLSAAAEPLALAAPADASADPYAAYLQALEIPADRFDAYARTRFGDGWREREAEVLAELEAALSHPDDYRAEVTVPF